MISTNPIAVVVSARSFEFDGHKAAYSVTERATGRLMGHVAKSDMRPGCWAYLGATEPSGTWTLSGWSRAEAVRSLCSWWSPCAPWLATETDPQANPNLFR
jgi:hypothetical protein